MKKCPSEKKTYRDPESGIEVTQWTNYCGHSHHLYFTNPGWYDDGRKLLFASDRNNIKNLFGINLVTGELEQITDFSEEKPGIRPSFHLASLNPKRDEAYLIHERRLKAIDLKTGKESVLNEVGSGWNFMMTNCSADGKYVYYGTSEYPSGGFEVDLANGYVGSEQIWSSKPQSRIHRTPVNGEKTETIFEEKYWIGHVNTSPTQPHLLTYCHEGPWAKVDNRIWGLDASTGRNWKIRPRKSDENPGHEYWYADGLRIGFHGEYKNRKNFIGGIEFDNSNHFEAAFPGWTGHIFSLDENLIIGDGNGVIRVWKWNGEKYLAPRLLCRHDSSMKFQESHPHPRISPDGKYVIFSSDRRGGYVNVYTVPIVDFESLPEIKGET
ncbi:MAG TPA: oligogalacturonide lyase [Lentisphaeria bacterium]|nr:MAG: hypothetical protein A2X45_22395 [Lentisphaerae bacterium GWF2_50_93]HCE45049.1 oligogalacturonide lyase [Lentisphaeria bacterium]